MKSITKTILLYGVIMGLVLCLSQTALASGSFCVTTGVNVRDSESTSGKTLTTVSGGESVGVLEHNPAGWSKVQVGSTVGYIRSDFLKYTISSESETFYTTTGVNLRESASTSSKSLAAVSAGVSVEVFEHDPAGWSKVSYGGTAGYIRSDFLKHTATASISGGSSSDAAAGAGIGQLQTLGKVNLRTAASTSSNILKTLDNGTVVDVLENDTNGWSKVTHGDSTGYIRSDLLAPLGEAQQVPSETLYTTGNVNFRKSASTSGDIIRTLAKSTAVEVLESGTNGWSKVRVGSTDGYIKSDLLTASAQGESQTRYTVGNVNLRSGPSTSTSVIRTLANGTSVTVASQDNGWSKVTCGDSSGYIRSDLLSDKPIESGIVAVMKVTEPLGARVRSGPSTSTSVLETLVLGTSVTVLANESNGWSRVNTARTSGGYIRSDLLGTGANVELVTMSEIAGTLPFKQNVRIVDVRTGVSFNIRIFSKGTHADYDFPTREDTNAMFSTRGGVRSWAARPVWVYAGDRIYAAATHGMPHDVSFIGGNGVDGHFCLHFHNTTANSQSYQSDLRKAVLEAYEKRPR